MLPTPGRGESGSSESAGFFPQAVKGPAAEAGSVALLAFSVMGAFETMKITHSGMVIMDTFRENDFKSALKVYYERARDFSQNVHDFCRRLVELPFSALVVFFVIVCYCLSTAACLILIGIDYTTLAEIPRIANASLYITVTCLYALILTMAFQSVHVVDTVPRFIFKNFISDYNIPEISFIVRSVGIGMLVTCISITIVPLLVWGYQSS